MSSDCKELNKTVKFKCRVSKKTYSCLAGLLSNTTAVFLYITVYLKSLQFYFENCLNVSTTNDW